MDETNLVKQKQSEIASFASMGGFAIDAQSDNINKEAIAKVNKVLPELVEKTKAFGSGNSQTTLAMMSLTMLGGQSPYRMLRQILAEVEQRKGAVAESQIQHQKIMDNINMLEKVKSPSKIEQARLRHLRVRLHQLENKINGGFTDLATLCDAYNNIKEKNGIVDWDEQAFEKEEKKHHVRRCFELIYRNLLVKSRVSESSVEYTTQFGVHPQVAIQEVSGYLSYTEDRISKGEILHSNDLEDFLDQMAEKYIDHPDATSERLFGKKDFTNNDFMYKAVTK